MLDKYLRFKNFYLNIKIKKYSLVLKFIASKNEFAKLCFFSPFYEQQNYFSISTNICNNRDLAFGMFYWPI